MKTQLLEDIGQSAALSPAPSTTSVGSKAGRAPGAPPASATQESGGQTSPLDLDDVFEEIAALEAQYVAPNGQHDPAAAAVDPAPGLAMHAEGPREPGLGPAEPTLDPLPTHGAAHGAAAPHDPLFDFTQPAPATEAAAPITRVAAGRTRSGPRYLLWAACLLVVALLVQGGRWLVQERSQAGPIALAGAEAKDAPRVDEPAQPGALAARVSTAGPAAEVDPAPSRPAPAVPPLVMLEPAPSAAGKAGQRAPAPEPEPEPGPAAAQESAPAAPKPASRAGRAQSDAAAEPAAARREREPVRHTARVSAATTDRPSAIDTSLAATLKACREHGYHATQCVKRGCAITEYGFVCRGR